MSDLRQLFFESAAELVQKLNDEAMQLEKSPGDSETTRSIRRTVHTLKGDAAACGFRELGELCHEFEDVLTLADGAAAALVPGIALRAADLFAALLAAYRKGTKLPDLEAVRADIARLANPAASATVETNLHTTRPARAKSGRKANAGSKAHQPEEYPWTEYERLAIARACADGKRVYGIAVQLDPQCGMPIVARQMVHSALADLGEVLAFHPADGHAGPLAKVEVALASEKSLEGIRRKCAIPTVALKVRVQKLDLEAFLALAPSSAVVPTEFAPESPHDSSRIRKEVRNENDVENKNEEAEKDAGQLDFAPSAAESRPQEAPAPPSAPGSPITAPLRVDAGRIDSVLNLVGELILAKSMLQQAVLEFEERFPKDGLQKKFTDAMAFQSRVLNDLQHSVMKIRMVPVEQLFRRFPRIVRDVGLLCGKEVDLVLRGEQTDLDKSILDAIAEPLTHLVRNAIGHGIEAAEERLRAGKPARGTLHLAAYHQGNQVVIEVSDDGAGIDVEKIRRRALSQGLIGEQQAERLSDAETLNLILQPGFSTAEQITELSGRGVGLDVVESVLARLKGTIQIETVVGRGTTFRMRLPLTLAIIRALLFRVRQRLYALPLNAVAEITRAFESDIHQVEHYDVLQLRQDVLPLLRLGAKPADGPAAAGHKVFVLVINAGEQKFGVLVDAIEGEEELVIKALDDHSITTDLVSGASILGDGRVVLILNMIALMERFTRGRADSRIAMAGLLAGSAVARATTQVDGSVGVGFATAGGQA